MSNRLFVDEIVSVGMVAAGDNPDAEVLIYKNRNTGEFIESRIHSDFTMLADRMFGDGRLTRDERIALSSGIGDALNAFREKIENEVPELYDRDPELVVKARAVAAAIKGYVAKHRIPNKKSKMTTSESSAGSAPTKREVNMDLSAIEDETLRKSIEDKIAEDAKTIIELESQVVKEETDPVDEASDEVKTLIKDRDDQIQTLRKDLDEERTTRRTKEYVDKAAAFVPLLGNAEEVGPIMADLADKAPESWGKLESALTAAAQREGMAKLFSELGTGEGEGESDPLVQRDVWVEKNRKEDETVSQTRSRFWIENPEAVEASRSN